MSCRLKYIGAVLVSLCLAAGGLRTSASEPAEGDAAVKPEDSSGEAQEPEGSGGAFSWLVSLFSISPEEREAREAALREEADAVSRELAEAIDSATDEEEKARLQKKADDHAEREARRRAEVKARAAREAERASAREARRRQREEAAAEKLAAREAREEEYEREQVERAEALKARLEAMEKTRAEAEEEARVREEREIKDRVEAVAAAAAERRAREEAEVMVELERLAEMEEIVRSRMDAKTRTLADALAAAEHPEEMAELEREAEEHAENEARRRAAYEAREARIKARWEARSQALAQREERDIARAARPVPERSAWRISAGAIYRTIKSRTFKTDSYSQSYPIPARSRDTTYRFDPAGDSATISDRDYIDGYVYRDGMTYLDSGTWNWGYERGSQVRDDMVYMRWHEYTREWFARDTDIVLGEREQSNDGAAGVYLRAERVLKQHGPFDYGVMLDASRVSFSSSGNHVTFRDRQEWATIHQYAEDGYSVVGTGITPASDPYRGDAATPGPTINNTPDVRRSTGRRTVASGTYEAFNSVEESLGLDLSTFSLGLGIAFNYRGLHFSGATGPTLSLVNTDARYEEVLYESIDGGAPSVLETWSDRQSATKFNPGFFVQGEIGLRLIHGFGLGVFGRYDWTESVSGDVGAMHYRVNPEGGSLGGTLNYAF